ncbi:MAG: arsenite methyltransferase [Candidatus Latescibacterota bacterium]|nr:MAG: arsenite methyltransferase [Candidatus Latescibacterota bacterium]
MSDATTRAGEERNAPPNVCCEGSSSAASAPLAAPIAEETSSEELRRLVRDKYGQLARESQSCCGSGADQDLERLGYSRDQSEILPEGANLGLGCGNPLAHAAIRVGETVLDLGSGAGIDVFLAAREVGPLGRALGVDMTHEMLERARENARRAGIDNVEFRLGEIEHLPVANDSVDLVISNCVINLSPDKPQVFSEAYRVLKPGGRLVVSDLVLTRPLPAEVRESVEAYTGCIAGASLRDDYLRQIRAAGFRDVETVEERGYVATGAECCVPDPVAESVLSMKVRAWKR